MIKTRKELKRILKLEKKNYNYSINKFYIIDKYINESQYVIWKYQKLLRIVEYHFNNKKNLYHLAMYIYYGRRKQKLGIKLGFSIPHNVFDEGLIIDHYGSIVVNGCCKIGKNCRLHGNNCIGNKGKGREEEYPIIGDNVDIGYGATIIGKVKIASNCKIGSGSVVVENIEKEGAIIVGIPGKIKR